MDTVSMIISGICIGFLATVVLGCIFYLCARVYDLWERRQARLEAQAEYEEYERLREEGDQEWLKDEQEMEANLEVLRALIADLEDITDAGEANRCLDASIELTDKVDEYLRIQTERDIADWIAVVPTVEPNRTLPPNLRRL